MSAYAAMLKAGYKRKAKLSPAAYARRLAAEKLLQQRRYLRRFRAVAGLPAPGLPADATLRRRRQGLS